MKKLFKKHEKNGFTKNLIFIFLRPLHVIFFFLFDAENISKKFIFLAVTVAKIHARKVVSFYRVASMSAYKYLKRIILLFLVSH